MIGTLLVIAKEPRAGQVKTRLVPPFSYDQAADLAAAALRDTLGAADRVPARRRTLVFAGDAAGWVRPGWEVAEQVGGGLDLRLAAAFATADAHQSAVLIGMDTPQFEAAALPAGYGDDCDAWLGPAADGGFWAIGFARPADAARVLPGVPMSRADTGAITLQRMRDAGLTVRLIDTLVDVDDAASARTVAAAAPRTEFARLLARIEATRMAG